MHTTLTAKKWLIWGLWGALLAIIVGFWWSGAASQEVTSGDGGVAWYAFARLFGLVATFCALSQFIAMGRVGWLEPIFGLDRLAIFHRRNGIATLVLILMHSVSMIQTHIILTGGNQLRGIELTLGLPYVWLAVIAEALFIIAVVSSIVVVRKHLRFETWYAVHLINYAAIALVPFHQLTNGSDFLDNPTYAYYWIGLYVFTALNMVVWRFGKPLWSYSKHRFRVQKIVQETPTATSVYITGLNLDSFKAKGGQFVLVRFLDKKRIWQEHPFSLSAMPSSDYIRLTIRNLGDFTNTMPQLASGTPVIVSGPYGTFTHQQRVKNKILYIAGGIGITPIRSMIEEQVLRNQKADAVLLYGNRTTVNTALLGELQTLATTISMPMYTVLSDDKASRGEQGYIDLEKIKRLVPDVAERDIFLCGPPPMMAGVKKALQELGLSKQQVHYERFSLHKD